MSEEGVALSCASVLWCPVHVCPRLGHQSQQQLSGPTLSLSRSYTPSSRSYTSLIPAPHTHTHTLPLLLFAGSASPARSYHTSHRKHKHTTAGFCPHRLRNTTVFGVRTVSDDHIAGHVSYTWHDTCVLLLRVRYFAVFACRPAHSRLGEATHKYKSRMRAHVTIAVLRIALPLPALNASGVLRLQGHRQCQCKSVCFVVLRSTTFGKCMCLPLLCISTCTFVCMRHVNMWLFCTMLFCKSYRCVGLERLCTVLLYLAMPANVVCSCTGCTTITDDRHSNRSTETTKTRRWQRGTLLPQHSHFNLYKKCAFSISCAKV